MPAVPRSSNRNEALLDAAAELFSEQGFRGTTVRDIARAVGMLPGSVYYHHASKDDLLLAVYETGVERFIEEFGAAVAEATDPWERFRAGLAAHIGAITRSSPFMRVINRVRPEQVPKHAAELVALRDRYEGCFRELIDDLPLCCSKPRARRMAVRTIPLHGG